MKKILLILSFLASFSFATTLSDVYGNQTYFYRSSDYCYKNLGFSSLYDSGDSCSFSTNYELTNSTTAKFNVCNSNGTSGYYIAYYNIEQVSNAFCVPCPDGQIHDDTGQCVSQCQENATYNDTVSACVCDDGYHMLNGSCIENCAGVNNYARDDGSCLDCSGKSTDIDTIKCLCAGVGSSWLNTPTMSVVVDYQGTNYEQTYMNCNDGHSFEVLMPVGSSSTPPPPDDCPDASYPDTPYGFILKGTVQSVDECQAFVDNVNYTDFRVLPGMDCDGTYDFCFLKTSVDNNDTGITPPDENNPDTNITSDVPDVTPPAPSTPNNTDLTGVNQKLQQSNNWLAAIKQTFDDVRDGQGQVKNQMGAWINQSRLDNQNQLNAQVQTTHATNRVKDSIDKLNGDLAGKLDTLVENSQKIVDKNNSVDLSGVEDKLDTLHDDLNSTNDKLSKIADAFNTDDNVTYPDTGVDDNSTAPALSDLLPDDSFFNSNTLDLSNLNNYSGDCYLESFSWTDGSGTHTFPPQNLMDMIPFNIVSNIMFAFLYLLGLREFLRS